MAGIAGQVDRIALDEPAAPTARLEFTAVDDDLAATDNRDRPAPDLPSFERRIIHIVMGVIRSDRPLQLRIPDRNISVRPNRDRALLGMHAKNHVAVY